MILVDPRAGSGDLVDELGKWNVEARHSFMEYGDVAFLGNGPNDQPRQIGIEVKTINDVLDCTRTGRFTGHQLPGLLETYEEPWLLVEGVWSMSEDGEYLLVHGSRYRQRGDVLYGPFMRWLESIQNLPDPDAPNRLRMWRTTSRSETARWIALKYRWWTEKKFSEHKSLKTFASYKASATRDRKDAPMPAMIGRPSFMRRIAKELPGCGWERSQAVASAFPSIIEMASATEQDWRRIDGIGAIIAKRILKAIRTGEE